MKKITILVTGFGPFGGENVNPSEMILKRLPDNVVDVRIEKLLLPVEFVGSREIAIAKYDELCPDAVIMLGQAGGRSAITPETMAKNLMNAKIPDNAGYKPENEKIAVNGSNILYSALPTEKIVEAIKASGVPASISSDAGGYVCNCLFYSMLYHNSGAVPTGFIHVPYIKEQNMTTYMEFNEMYKGIAAAIKAVIDQIKT